ncbi:hypothetical protein OC835_006953 [Tilletia horrida]|nr:hypothetical protein OC835_006953 [Tilletia horrida]
MHTFALSSSILLSALAAFGTPVARQAQPSGTSSFQPSVPLASILSAPTPALALGQAMSQVTNPDPLPSPSGSYPLTTSDTPLALPNDLLQTFMGKTLPYAAASYCNSVNNGSWTCGPYCQANPNFQITAVGGDGGTLQRWFVGYNPPTNEIILSRQGAGANQLATVLYVTSFLPATLHPDIARTLSRVSGPRTASSPPVGVLGSILDPVLLANNNGDEVQYAVVNDGMQTSWNSTWPGVKAAVQAQLNAHPNAARVFVVGHSFGTAVALFDALALRSIVPDSIPVQISGTGQPRAGNPVFANLVDTLVQQTSGSTSGSFTYHHIINHDDLFPHLPPLVSGYEHSINEVWITQSNSTPTTPTYLCTTRENVNCGNSQGLGLNMLDHPGPYWGIFAGANCTA